MPLRSEAAPDACRLTPDTERVGPGYSVVAGRHAMASRTEVAADRPVRGQELLGVTGRLEALHLPLSSSRRLVRHRGAVVEVTALPVLDAGHELLPRRVVAGQLIAIVVIIQSGLLGRRGG